jgi:hypothetical protein
MVGKGCGVRLCPDDGGCAGGATAIAGGVDCGGSLSEQAEMRTTQKTNNPTKGFNSANGFNPANGFNLANGFNPANGFVIIVRVI